VSGAGEGAGYAHYRTLAGGLLSVGRQRLDVVRLRGGVSGNDLKLRVVS
jgi:hypothetical protein